MNWVDDAATESKRINDRKDAIAGSADKIYQNLWDEITRTIPQILSKGRDVGTNGTPLERMLWMSVIPRGHQTHTNRRECSITLSPNRDIIRASGGGVDLTLSIDVCKDGVVCLKHGNEELTLAKAAELILRPFAFHELYPQG
jgi:hypothetical protein